MFLKAQDFNPGGNLLPNLYECHRIHPEQSAGDTFGLRLEGPGDQAVSIELLPGWTYFVLNQNGGNVETYKAPRKRDAE